VSCDLTSSFPQMTTFTIVLDALPHSVRFKLRAILPSDFVLPAPYPTERSTTGFVRTLARSLHDWNSQRPLLKSPLFLTPKHGCRRPSSSGLVPALLVGRIVGWMAQPLCVLCRESSSHWNRRPPPDRPVSTSMNYDLNGSGKITYYLIVLGPRNWQMPIKRDSDVEDCLPTKGTLVK